MTSSDTNITEKLDAINRIEEWYAKGWITKEMKKIYKTKINFPAIGKIVEEVYFAEAYINYLFSN